MISIHRLAVLGAASLAVSALAGCGGSETIEAEDESVESVAERVAESDIKPRPGMWESKVTLEKVEIPGMPADMQGMMKEQLGRVTVSSSCLTPEEVDKPDADFFQLGEESGCKYNSFKMGGGKIDADMTCEQQGMQQNMKMTGTYNEEAYTMQVSADAEMEGRPMSMAMTVESHRIGECDDSETE